MFSNSADSDKRLFFLFPRPNNRQTWRNVRVSPTPVSILQIVSIILSRLCSASQTFCCFIQSVFTNIRMIGPGNNAGGNTAVGGVGARKYRSKIFAIFFYYISNIFQDCFPFYINLYYDFARVK